MTTKKSTRRQSDLQRRLAECERGAKLIKALFDAGEAVPDFLTDAIFDAIHAASALKSINYWSEEGGDFDLEQMAVLFLASSDVDLRHGPDAIAFRVSEILQNPKDCPVEVYNALADATCGVEAEHNSFGIIARHFRGYALSEKESELKGGEGR
jgi:hypothetical protein